MEEFNQELLDFLKKGTCAYTCIEDIKNTLLDNDYVELKESEDWDIL